MRTETRHAIRVGGYAPIRDYAVIGDGRTAVARQRRATANGVVFMLSEDTFGAFNLIVPPSVYDLHRGKRVERNQTIAEPQ